jgi:hypothetical protein
MKDILIIFLFVGLTVGIVGAGAFVLTTESWYEGDVTRVYTAKSGALVYVRMDDGREARLFANYGSWDAQPLTYLMQTSKISFGTRLRFRASKFSVAVHPRNCFWSDVEVVHDSQP